MKEQVRVWEANALIEEFSGASPESLALIYFDHSNKRVKTLDLNHKHEKMKPHVHHGYFHNENELSKKGATKPTAEEKQMIERVERIWYSFLKERK